MTAMYAYSPPVPCLVGDDIKAWKHTLHIEVCRVGHMRGRLRCCLANVNLTFVHSLLGLLMYARAQTGSI